MLFRSLVFAPRSVLGERRAAHVARFHKKVKTKASRPEDRSARLNRLEAKPGFEPGVKALQASALPLGHFANMNEKGRSFNRPESCNGADNGARTRDPNLGKVVLYQLSHVRLRGSTIRECRGVRKRKFEKSYPGPAEAGFPEDFGGVLRGISLCAALGGRFPRWDSTRFSFPVVSDRRRIRLRLAGFRRTWVRSAIAAPDRPLPPPTGHPNYFKKRLAKVDTFSYINPCA